MVGGFCVENMATAVVVTAAATTASASKCIEFLRMHAINVVYVESELRER